MATLIQRPTYKSLAKPMRVRGVTRTLAGGSVLTIAIVDRLALLRVSPLMAMAMGIAAGCLVYLAAKEALRRDPAFFQIWWAALQSKARYDAAKSDPVEVRLV